MNSIATRFSSRANREEEETDHIDASMWGSSAGFGNIGPMGVPQFDLPGISNVRVSFTSLHLQLAQVLYHTAYSIPSNAH